MTEERSERDAADGVGPRELERALPVEPIDASLRMRVQRAARASFERREERSVFFWQDALVPGTLLVAGVFYAAGALQKLVEIFG
ncbi:MAG: hypothetical protein J0L92_19745 [Deltaproteobacteria bacterium]|nr:hypothetical protein [Deltaproteobacteria bacterium]